MLQPGSSRVRLPVGVFDCIFSALYPSSRTMAPKFTQILTEMSTGTFLGVKLGRRVRLTT
jgi:hypothetical protein